MYRHSQLIITLFAASTFYGCSFSQPQPINGKWLNFTKNNSGLLDNYVRDIEVDTANNVWIVAGNTYGGFFLKRTDGRLTMYDGEWKYFKNPYLDNSRYFYENLHISINGDKWMGKNGGDLEHTSSFYRFSAQNDWKAFVADDNTLDMVSFTSLNDSTMLIRNTAGIGTIMAGYDTFQLAYGITFKDNQDLFKYDNLNFQQNIMAVIRTMRYPTTDMKVIDDSTILSYTFKGLSYFHYGDGKLEHIRHIDIPDDHEENTKDSVYVNNIWTDNTNGIWVGYGNGIFKFENDSFAAFFKPDSLKWNRILDLKFDENNKVWFVTLHSFVSFDGKKWDQILLNGSREMDWFTCLEIDRKGNIWIGTRYQGIFVYNPNGLKVPGYE